jgi:hypothetical protein
MDDKTHFENRGIMKHGCPFLPPPRRVKPVSGSVTERIEFLDETDSIFFCACHPLWSVSSKFVWSACNETMARALLLTIICVRRVGRAAPLRGVTRPILI